MKTPYSLHSKQKSYLFSNDIIRDSPPTPPPPSPFLYNDTISSLPSSEFESLSTGSSYSWSSQDSWSTSSGCSTTKIDLLSFNDDLQYTLDRRITDETNRNFSKTKSKYPTKNTILQKHEIYSNHTYPVQIATYSAKRNFKRDHINHHHHPCANTKNETSHGNKSRFVPISHDDLSSSVDDSYTSADEFVSSIDSQKISTIANDDDRKDSPSPYLNDGTGRTRPLSKTNPEDHSHNHKTGMSPNDLIPLYQDDDHVKSLLHRIRVLRCAISMKKKCDF